MSYNPNGERDWIKDRDVVDAENHALEDVQLLRDIVLIRPDADGKVSPGGIILAAGEFKEQHSGMVMKTGPGVWKNGEVFPLGVVVGEKVYFNSFSGWRMRVGDEDLLVMKESDILGKEG